MQRRNGAADTVDVSKTGDSQSTSIPYLVLGQPQAQLSMQLSNGVQEGTGFSQSSYNFLHEGLDAREHGRRL